MPFNEDPTAEVRKKDHIELAFQSQIQKANLDQRFYYEPLLAAHPKIANSFDSLDFLDKKMQVPIWVSSMTGGTALANRINHNLAKACGDFGMGMGLGSCRSLLYNDEYLKDFDIRHLMGGDLPLYANLGIAQIEELIEKKDLNRVVELVDKLKADGLIIHINPLQEWMQPEGDRFKKPPIEIITYFLEQIDMKLIIKEVGHGMGYESLKALFQLPLEAVDFGANGGTNFSKIELLRSTAIKQETYKKIAYIGHSATEMVDITNQLRMELGDKMLCQQVIISGGIKDFLDGYYLIEKIQLPAIYGQASGFLKYAQADYETLYEYVQLQIEGLKLANSFLRIKE